jgi:HK97 family phage prohead protease
MSLNVITRETLLKALKAGGEESVAEGAVIRKALVPDSVEEAGERKLRFTISTQAVDRDNDTVDPKGWELEKFKQNPVVLWAHDYKTLPVGKATVVEMRDGKLISECEFAPADLNPFADTVYRMLKAGYLRATSVGFQPKAFKINAERDGLDFTKQELMEYSIVPVPSNPEALIHDFQKAAKAGIDISPMREWAASVLKGCRDYERMEEFMSRRDARSDSLATMALAIDSEEDAVRWNRSLSKAFDVDGEPVEPSTQFYKWVSRYLDTPVKDLFENSTIYGGAKMGALLSGLEDELAEQFKTVSVRNLHGHTEAPPIYETIRLNSKQSRDFLIEGARFLAPANVGAKVVIRIQPTWGGLYLQFYAERKHAEAVGKLMADAVQRASTYKFLKGEAFSLSGEFLQRSETTWEDLFLSEKQIDPIKRCVDLLKAQGGEMESRGMILMGPPGTGKTLAGKVMMNDAKDATYIWCSSRDFYRMGMFGGIQAAYDIAQENAPTVLFIEDIDSWWSESSVDLVKTELDGLKAKKGIVTVLTTNFPEKLPEALIDRPGRFHDVIDLTLPDEAVRRRMLDKWAPEASETTRASLAKETAGLSGAHLRELVRFANTIRTQDAVELDAALATALAKVNEQREVIAASRRGRKGVAVKMLSAPVAPEHGVVKFSPEKAGAAVGDHCDTCMAPLKAEERRVKAGDELTCIPCFRKEMGSEDVCCKCQGKDAVAGCACKCHGPAKKEPEVPATEASVLELDDDAANVIELDDSEGDALDLTPSEVQEAVKGALTELVSAVVREQTRAAIDRARGRVD